MMPAAKCPPCCPFRAALFPAVLLAIFLTSWQETSTAAESADVQLNDYRLVVPAGHMQLWPDDEAAVSHPEVEFPLPAEPKPLRIATKWRTTLVAPQKNKAEQKATEAATSAPSELKVAQPTNTEPQFSVQVIPEPVEPELPIVPTPAQVPLPQPVTPEPIEPQRLSSPQIVDDTPQKPTPEQLQGVNCYQAPPLSASSTSIALPTGALPKNVAAECALENSPTGDLRLVGGWRNTEFHWSATCMHHQPLYFEEINVERYGYTVSYCLQPLISAGRFFATIPALPYKMMIDRPCDCVYTLGHYRPGSCAPRRASHLPLKLGATAVECGWIAGLILLVP